MDLNSLSEKTILTMAGATLMAFASEGRKMWKTYLYSKKLTSQLMNAPDGQMIPMIADQISGLKIDRDECRKENEELKNKMVRMENKHEQENLEMREKYDDLANNFSLLKNLLGHDAIKAMMDVAKKSSAVQS